MKSREEEIAMLRSFIRTQVREDRKRLNRRLQEARADFSRIVELIKDKYRPERIYQWGSLLDGDTFRDISDIDIAVEGIRDPEVFFRLLAECERLSSFPLHIIQIEHVHPVYREEILRKGVLVYERQVS